MGLDLDTTTKGPRVGDLVFLIRDRDQVLLGHGVLTELPRKAAWVVASELSKALRPIGDPWSYTNAGWSNKIMMLPKELL